MKFVANGGFCAICDANHAEVLHPIDGSGICRECFSKYHSPRSVPEPPAKWCCDGRGSDGHHADECRYSEKNFNPITKPPNPITSESC